MVLPTDWKDQLDRLNRVLSVHGTTALEGNPLSEAEVEEQFDQMAEDREPPANLSKEQIQIRNAGVAQDWVRKRFAPSADPIRLSDVMHLHKLVTEKSDEVKNVPGDLRHHPVVVGTEALGGVHRGAPSQELPALMAEFVNFVNSRTVKEKWHPVIRALLAHFFLVTIHPFGDGNGRVSRLVEAGLLYEGGYNVLGFYGLSNYFYRNADEYKRLLQKSRRTQPFDLTAFVGFGLKGFAEDLRGINNFIKTKLNRLVYRAMLLRAFNRREGKRRRIINQREYNLLEFLLEATEPKDPFSAEPSRHLNYFELRQAAYVKAAYRDVSERTFHRELSRLGERGFIKFQAVDQELMVALDFEAIGKY
ncbi:MAG: Fic family protein [Gammaproteobacteria bacterium]|nr:Fic family protein [Gammaproteobacteria bacterium]